MYLLFIWGWTYGFRRPSLWISPHPIPYVKPYINNRYIMIELSPADLCTGHSFYRTTDVSYSISVLSEKLGTLLQLQILTYLSSGTEVCEIVRFFCLFFSTGTRNAKSLGFCFPVSWKFLFDQIGFQKKNHTRIFFYFRKMEFQ